MRTLPECQGSVKRYIIDANPSMDFSFYIYATVDNETQVSEAQRLASTAYPIVKSVLVLSGNQTSQAVRQALPTLESLPPGSGTAKGKAGNIAQMLMGLSIAERLCGLPSPPVVRQSIPPPRRNLSDSDNYRVDHDLVLRLRPDLCFCRPLILRKLLGKNAVHVPWMSSGMAFDQLAAGPPGLMARYSAAFETTLPKEVALQHELYPEKLLALHLESERLPLRKLRGLHASLNRGAGVFDDPFGKLKVDFAQHRFPTHTCER